MSLKKYCWLPKLTFPAKNLIETKNIFAIRGNKTLLFHSVRMRTNKQHTPCQKPHATK